MDRWFDPSAFTTPAAVHLRQRRPQHPVRPGPRERRLLALQGVPGERQRVRVQFRAEAFNLFNHPQFDLPNATIGAGNAGTITGIVGTPRQIQFGLKASF